LTVIVPLNELGPGQGGSAHDVFSPRRQSSPLHQKSLCVIRWFGPWIKVTGFLSMCLLSRYTIWISCRSKYLLHND